MTYDDADRLRTINEDGQTTTYTYTRTQLTSKVDPAGTTLFTYRPLDGRLGSILDPFQASAVITYSYDSAGRPWRRTDPAGLTIDRTFEPGSGRLQEHIVKRGTTTLARFALKYDDYSNVVERTQVVSGYPSSDSGLWAYDYDTASRLTKSTDPSGVSTLYGYDGAGNRTSVKVGASPAITTTYDPAGHPASTSDGTTYTTDKMGNLTSIQAPGRNWTLSYDAWNRLRSADPGGSAPQISYAYDALDRTMRRTSGSAVTSYAYSGNTEEVASTTIGGAITTFAHGPTGPIGERAGSSTRYYIRDLHSDVVGMVESATGGMAGTVAYSPWGERRSTSGVVPSLGYQGDPADASTGLVDMTARLYDPSLGRFITRDAVSGDPLDPMSTNQFIYGFSNPVTLADPSGLFPLPEECGSCPPGYLEWEPPATPSEDVPKAVYPDVPVIPVPNGWQRVEFIELGYGRLELWIGGSVGLTGSPVRAEMMNDGRLVLSWDGGEIDSDGLIRLLVQGDAVMDEEGAFGDNRLSTSVELGENLAIGFESTNTSINGVEVNWSSEIILLPWPGWQTTAKMSGSLPGGVDLRLGIALKFFPRPLPGAAPEPGMAPARAQSFAGSTPPQWAQAGVASTVPPSQAPMTSYSYLAVNMPSLSSLGAAGGAFPSMQLPNLLPQSGLTPQLAW